MDISSAFDYDGTEDPAFDGYVAEDESNGNVLAQREVVFDT
jgi:hypothetical protein